MNIHAFEKQIIQVAFKSHILSFDSPFSPNFVVLQLQTIHSYHLLFMHKYTFAFTQMDDCPWIIPIYFRAGLASSSLLAYFPSQTSAPPSQLNPQGS